MAVNFGIILQYYYPERADNLGLIMEELYGIAERRFMVNNSGGPWGIPGWKGWHSLDMPVNRVYNRNLVPLLYPEIEYWYLQDDDLLVKSDDVLKLVAMASSRAGLDEFPFCGIEGRILGTEPGKRYTTAHGNRYLSYVNTHTDMVLRAMAFHRTAILPGLRRLMEIGEATVHEDLLFTMGHAAVVPDVDWTNLDECGVGIVTREGIKDDRNAFVEKLINVD